MSFFAALTLLFVTLKLVGIIGWSWWLVLLPLYGGAALALFIALIGLIIAAFTAYRRP